jgi:RNA polymerase sigma-70 factor (ECF subfamily)
MGEPRAIDDEDGRLLQLARTDIDSFGTFFDRTNRDIVRFFYRRTACPHTSAELMSETYAVALSKVSSYEPARGTGRAWLFGIANNQFRQWLRRGRVSDRARRRLALTRIELDDVDIDRIETLVDFAPVQEALAAALEELPTPMRDAVVLRIGHDIPYIEVAARLGCTVNNARVRVSRALERLGATLEGS